jgi:hypothetical protein
MTTQSIALRRAFLPKWDVFRQQFEQTDNQLPIKSANDAEYGNLDILYLLKRAESRIDFSQAPNE